MYTGPWLRMCRGGVVVLAVGAFTSGVKLEGAPASSDAKNKTVVAAEAPIVSRGSNRTAANRIRVGNVPSSLPIMPVVTANYLDDEPSRLRAAGLLKGPMPLFRSVAGGIATTGDACTFDIECEDGDPCTDDFCDISLADPPGAGVCNNEVVENDDQGDLNGDDCSDGLTCTGTETCQGAAVFACEGVCVGGYKNGLACIRETDCSGGGTCTGEVCLGGPNNGVTCVDNSECGSSPGTCVAGTPVTCPGGEVCDENHYFPGCVTACTNHEMCDDFLACNGVEVCDPGTGLCSSPGNPCGGEAATCLERMCISGYPEIDGKACEADIDCNGAPGGCGHNGPYCFLGRCCIGGVAQVPNKTFAECQGLGGDWYPGDHGQLQPADPVACPVYSSGIGDAGEYIVTVGPASLSTNTYDLLDRLTQKIGDDYHTNGGEFLELQYLRFAGGVTTTDNGVIAFEFYDANGAFVEDVFFTSAAGADQIQVVQVFVLSPTLAIPPNGFIIGYVHQNFAETTSARGEFFWLSTDVVDAGTNDPNFLVVETDFSGTPNDVPNFLGVCSGGDRDGFGCDLGGMGDSLPDCPGGGTCDEVPGVLAFELEGTLTGAPIGACCDANSGACDEVLEWICDSVGGEYAGDETWCSSCSNDSPNVGASCRTCNGGGNDGLSCTGADDCPGGTCDLNDFFCRFCEGDFETPCTSDADCSGVGGPCSPGACEMNASCSTGACCVGSDCQIDHTESSCAIMGGVFQGVGTDCDPSCCVQSLPYPGSDNCGAATVSVMEIPGGSVCLHGTNQGSSCSTTADCGGSACERTIIKTITGDNTTASSTIADPDSCFPPQDAPGGELGWFEAIEIVDPSIRPDDTIGCAYLVIDHCCTDPVKIPAYRNLFTSCPCGYEVSSKPNPNHPDRPPGAYGRPICEDGNAWNQFGPLTEGTYYYPIHSALMGSFGQYQLHVRAEACPDAVCCVGDNCKLVNILECQAQGGYFLAPPSVGTAVTVCADQCFTGSCCVGPGECIDHGDPSQNPVIVVTKQWCDSEGGRWVGGVRCAGGICEGGTREGLSCRLDLECAGGVCAGDALDLAQPSPCPICEIQGPSNCQLFDDSVGSRFSDRGMPGGGTQVADDFKPHSDTIDKVCVWGNYSDANGNDCADTALDNFRVVIYESDENGLPDVATRVERFMAPGAPYRAEVENSALSLLNGTRVWSYQIDLSRDPFTGLDDTGNTCYWVEVTNRSTDGVCGWSWMTVDQANNDYSAHGFHESFGIASPRNGDQAFCLSSDFEPGACGTPLGYCCHCDGTCANETRRDCVTALGQWRVDGRCESFACNPGAPDNDLCTTVVQTGFPDMPEGFAVYDNSCALSDGVNPVSSEESPGANDVNVVRDMWYRYIATCHGTVTISTCGTGTDGLDSIVTAYKDPTDPTVCVCPSEGSEHAAAVAWYDEPSRAGGVVHAADENCDGMANGGGGYISGPVSPGECVMIRVGGVCGPNSGGETGAGVMAIRCGFWEPGGPIVPVDGGNRYIRITVPEGESGPRNEVLRVRIVSLDGSPTPAQDYLYVGAPFAAPEEDSAQPSLTFTAAPLSCDPVFHDWSGEGVISIYGAEIMPGSEYEVQRTGLGCADLDNEACWSSPATITTLKYGDVAALFDAAGNPPQPDFNDIAAVVQKFLASPTAPIKAVCQLQPNVVFPLRPIDFRDVAADVQAFLGVSYADSYDGPCTCPPSVTCGTTVCANDLGCVGNGDGLCANGVCTDKCGRCTP